MKNPEKRNSRILAALWDLFASVKLTVVVLGLLAATSVLGTLIPQNADSAAYMRTYGEFAYRILHVFDLFDMYHSWWFQTLIGLLTVSIIVCTMKRWPATWKIVVSRKVRIGSVQTKQPVSEFSDSRKPPELINLYQAYIGEKYQNSEIESDEKGFRIVAEKGRWTRLGIPVVHLSIVIVLVGALMGSFFGFDGYVNIPEGGSADKIQLRNSNDTLSLGFEVRCDDFNVSFYKSGSPKEFRSSLVILEDGRKVVEKDIIVNDPLRYKGINFFQSSYGSMPPKVVELSFTSKDSGQTAHHKASLGQTVDLPDGAGRFTVREYSRDYHYKGVEVGEAVLGLLDKPGKGPVEVVLPLRFPTFDKMRKGDWIISVKGHDSAFYTGLQVTKDPGVPLVYTGFSLLIIGCWVAFFISHKKVLVEIRTLPNNSSSIRVFGSATRSQIGHEKVVRKIGEGLKKL